MAFNDREIRIILALGTMENGYLFELSDAELEEAFLAIKRERGNAMTQAKRKIRVDLANKLGWHFAMDGGFMDQNGSKEWQEGGRMFAKLYQEYEKLMLEKLGTDEQLPDAKAS